MATKDRSERAHCQAKKTGNIEEKVANATKCTGKERKTVPPFTSCGGKKKWCPGRSEHIAKSYAWQNDMKASMNKPLQISPICRLLVEVRSCLTEPNAFTTKIKVGPCRRTQKPGHVARAFETQLSWLDTGTHLDASAVKQQ